MSEVTHNEMGSLPYIIAVDFDGTLVLDRFPEIGAPNKPLIDVIKKSQKNSPEVKFVLWTCRNNLTDAKTLDAAKKYLEEEHDLVFDAYNENIPEVQEMFGHDTRKVYANEYWDDKNNLFPAPYDWRGQPSL